MSSFNAENLGAGVLSIQYELVSVLAIRRRECNPHAGAGWVAWVDAYGSSGTLRYERMRDVLIATTNPGKLREIRRILVVRRQ